MFYLLSKVIYWLVMPTSLISWAVLVAIFTKKKKLKSQLLKLAAGLFFFFTNPMLAQWVINAWEPPAIPYATLSEKYDYAIVLSGITEPNRKPFDRIQFNKGADRIVHAVDLYHRGIVGRLIITGGSGTITYEGRQECLWLRDFAIQCGVPAQYIWLEDSARNTHENALFTTRKYIQPSDKIILVTSAFHMFRAQKCFQKNGIQVQIFPTDHYGGDLHYTPDEWLIPTIHGLRIWTLLTKEWLGIVAYRLAGYL